MNFLVRIFGIIGLILCIIPFQFKKHKHIVLCKMVSEISFSIQYFLLGGFLGVAGAFTGAWVDLVSGLRNFLFYKFVEKKWSTTPLIIVFAAVVIVLGVTSWNGMLSLLPIAAKLLTTVSYGMKNVRLLRLITLPSCLLWVSYNCTIGTWEAAIADSLALISILIAIYKFDCKGKHSGIKEEA